MLLQRTFPLQAVMISCFLMGGLSFMAPVVAGIPPVNTSSDNSAPTHSLSSVRASLAEVATPAYRNTLASLYASHGNQLMWQDKRATQQFEQQLAEVALSGVQPQFAQWLRQLANPQIGGLKRDLVLSDAMLGYLQFTSGITSNGDQWLYNGASWRLALPPAGLINRWQSAIADDSLGGFISSLAPQHPQYQMMHQALKKLLEDKRPWPQLTGSQTLRPGELSNNIPALREVLQRTGMMSAETAPAAPASEVVGAADAPLVHDDDNVQLDAVSPSAPQNGDMLRTASPDIADRMATTSATASGAYTPELVEAVKRFQRWQGLTPDGAIGLRTREWLNASPERRAALMALNIQRLRLLPDDRHNGIMVNIADYSLVYYNNGNTILSSRVIVGRPDRKTPLMHSALNTVVLNPPWNVPTTLVRKDIVPKVKRDPGYLYKHNYTLLTGWGEDAQVLDPSMIDWNMVSAASFPYRIRQAPGPGNSLGRYKFNMPNSEAIYLHDTPNHGLFQKDIRALSSGCVRVNRASDLASLLLKNVGWNDARISSTLKEGNTRFVPIRGRIPVNLFYLTAWVDDEGQAQFRTDIYNYDNTVRAGTQALYSARELLL